MFGKPFELIDAICKFQIKLIVVDMTSVAIFTAFHFLYNLQMGQTSYSVCLWQAFELIDAICKLWRN